MKNFLFLLFIQFCLISRAQTDSIPVLNTLKYVDVGIGSGLPDGEIALNAGLNLDINDLFALFVEYNMYLKEGEILYHETGMKAGPYYQFRWNSYIALSAGFSIMFTTSGNVEHFYNIPIQLRYNLGITKLLSLGIKGTYNAVLTEDYSDRGSVVLFIGIKFRN
ncbi:MAG TPA: hypothetical protein VHI78_00450 [Bacteroidales bacterium]|jgi:hypothetical protein|nr:hypothetical protein [Bacteroidales bacterium]